MGMTSMNAGIATAIMIGMNGPTIGTVASSFEKKIPRKIATTVDATVAGTNIFSRKAGRVMLRSDCLSFVE